MALNLSTLTSPATSGDVLQEATTTADFLENVPVFRNIARGSNKGGDAKQSVSLNQPRALPLIKNPQGNLGGYLYIPNVSGNYATGPSVTIGSNQTWEAEVDMVVTQWGQYILPMGGGLWSSGFGLIFYPDGAVRLFSKGAYGDQQPSGVTLGTPFNVKYGNNGTNLYVNIDDVNVFTDQGVVSQAASITHTIELNQQTLTNQGNYAIQKANLTVNSSVVFDCDFNGSTSIRHGDTKFKAAVGGFVSIASPELIPNGNFDTDTAWTKTGGWSIADGVATLSSVPNSSDLISTVIPVTAGKTYKIVVNVIATSGSFRLYDTGGVVAYSLNVGENVYSRVATGSTYSVVPLSLGSGTATIDSISVTEVSPDAKRDPITVVKKSVLRFDGVNDGFRGLFANNINGGYMFAAFSVLGDGGEAYGRVFGANISGGFDYQNTGFALRRLDSTETLNLRYSGGSADTHQNIFDDDRGDLLLESRLAPSSQKSKVNDADANNGVTTIPDTGVAATQYSISSNSTGASNLALDLEYLALFPSSITDAQADDVRNYINTRNSVFSLIQSKGYYFYNAQSAPVGAISSGSSAWNGRIVGSDNGDTNRYLTQSTSNDAPVGDGFKVTFADNTDHLDITNPNQAGWQIVGNSLGTFAYRVNNTAVTELNLLGNLGNASFRKAGDLYGIILLPESATGKDIEDARKLLIDRGASDGTTASSYATAWFERTDLVEFQTINMSNVTNVGTSWNSTSLIAFPAINFASATNFTNTWAYSSSLAEFRTTEMPKGADFTNAWRNTTALTSFPAGAKLGTEASNVNFTSAWRSSGLTSFPALDLSTAIKLDSTWRDCDEMVSFGLVDTSSVTNFNDAWLGCNSLVSFPSVDTSSGIYFYRTWYDLDSITDFPLLNVSAGRTFSEGWRFCVGLINFPAGLFDSWNPASISNGVFDFTWTGCNSLTAESVGNILQSIDASNQHGTDDGTSTGSPLGDSGIDIDYNVSTGSLSAATDAAVTSLKAKGWSIIVNNVTL